MTTYWPVINMLRQLLIDDLCDLVFLLNQPSMMEVHGNMSLVMEEMRFLGAFEAPDIINQIQHLKECDSCQNGFCKWLDKKSCQLWVQ